MILEGNPFFRNTYYWDGYSLLVVVILIFQNLFFVEVSKQVNIVAWPLRLGCKRRLLQIGFNSSSTGVAPVELVLNFNRS